MKKIKYNPWVRILLSLGLFFHILLWFYIYRYLRKMRLISKERFKRRVKRSNEKNAKRAYRLMVYLEGLFIKVGQFISTRFELLPKEYTLELSKLQDAVPPRPFEEMKNVIEGELGRKLNEVFDEFNRVPVASASLAQVHKARLKDGRAVAVKVQYPDIEKIVKVDLNVLKIILRFLEKLQKRGSLEPFYREFEKYISWELDFINEGKNAERVRNNFEGNPDVVIPGVFWEYSTRKVLVLEFIDGVKVTDREKINELGLDGKQVMEKVVSVYFEQILKHGFFQADPHPGNILVCRGGKIGLLDFGLSKGISPGLLQGLLKFVQGITLANPEMVKNALWEMGFRAKERSEEGLKEFSEFVVRYGRNVVMKSIREMNYQKVVEELAQMSRKNPIVKMPTDLILLGRVFSHLMGLGRFYKVRLNFPKILARYFQEGTGASR